MWFRCVWLARWAVIGGMVLSGCAVDTRPQDVEHFSTRRAASEAPARYAGNYVLFSDETAGATPQMMNVHLQPGEIVGFEIDKNQIPFAVAGRSRLQLSAGHYRFEMRPDEGQIDWEKTNVAVIEVVVVVVVVAVGVVATIIAVKGIHHWLIDFY